MKPIKLSFKDDDGKVIKTYAIGSIKTGMMDRVYELADRAKEFVGLKGVREWNSMCNALLVDVFKGQFSLDELQAGAEERDVKECFNAILKSASEEIIKNSEGESPEKK